MNLTITRWTSRIAAVLVAALLSSSAYQAIASARDIQTYPPPGRLVDVGGYRLHIYCVGEGEPTVVLEAGMSGWSTDWVLVQPHVAKATRVCAYDRAGYGWSDAGPAPRDSVQVARELHNLLSKAGIDGRIVLVGHSLGGLFAQFYARTYPQQVAGIILVDSVSPQQSLRMQEETRKKYEGNLLALAAFSRALAPTGILRIAGQPVTVIAGKLPAAYQDEVRAMGFESKAYQALDEEMASFEQSQAEVRDSPQVPHMPLAVISSSSLNDFPPGFSGDYMKTVWDELQADLSKSSTMPHIIAEESGHYIHIDQPQLAWQTILAMVDRIRAR